MLLALLPSLGVVVGLWLYYSLHYTLDDNLFLKAVVLGDLLVSIGTALTGVSAIAFSWRWCMNPA